jgi:hypothetical protein
MTGFLNRFFGRKAEGSGSKGQSDPKPEPKPKKEKGAFFLDPDQAKTLGNIDYMRTPVTVKKTFMQGAAEIVEQVSAIEKVTLSDSTKSAPAESAQSTPDQAAPIPPITERRRSGSDLDAFRKMARDIKRGE